MGEVQIRGCRHAGLQFTEQKSTEELILHVELSLYQLDLRSYTVTDIVTGHVTYIIINVEIL